MPPVSCVSAAPAAPGQGYRLTRGLFLFGAIMPVNNGGWAFPRPYSVNEMNWGIDEQAGMTLLDWFAGQAMAAMLTNPEWIAATKRAENKGEYPSNLCETISLQAYSMAQGMIKRREELEKS